MLTFGLIFSAIPSTAVMGEGGGKSGVGGCSYPVGLSGTSVLLERLLLPPMPLISNDGGREEGVVEPDTGAGGAEDSFPVQLSGTHKNYGTD